MRIWKRSILLYCSIAYFKGYIIFFLLTFLPWRWPKKGKLRHCIGKALLYSFDVFLLDDRFKISFLTFISLFFFSVRSLFGFNSLYLFGLSLYLLRLVNLYLFCFRCLTSSGFKSLNIFRLKRLYLFVFKSVDGFIF